MKASRICISYFLGLMVLISLVLSATVVFAQEVEASVNPIIVTHDSQGINVTVTNRFELYFNASHGGEITRYYDLISDPSRSANLAPPTEPPHDLWPMFTTGFYNPYNLKKATTGGERNATVTLVGQGNDYVVLQSTSRMVSPNGAVSKDVRSYVNYVNSTWLIGKDGCIFLNRALYTRTFSLIPQECRWYPFYFSRVKGFDDVGTFYFFNTTFAYTYTVSEETYQNNYTVFPLFPADSTGVFGVAVPFNNETIGGDGTSNIVLVYQLNRSMNINGWKSDTHNGEKWGTELGATHEFEVDYSMTTNTLRAMIVLTHEPFSEQSSIYYAEYFKNNCPFPLLEVSLTANKYVYTPGDLLSLYVSGIAYYNTMNLSVIVTEKNSRGEVVWQRDYGTHNFSEDQRWSDRLLLNSTIRLDAMPDEYTFKFQCISSIGTLITSDSVSIRINPP